MGLPVLAIKALTAGNGADARVDDILKLIPNTATEDNKLTDKDFVNSSIATETAHYISDDGEPFTSVSDLPTTDVTNNDYAFVTGTDTAGNTYYDRYKATVSGDTVTWAKEYRLNNSSFTAEQWAAISSGITQSLVTKLNGMKSVLIVEYGKVNFTQEEAHAIELAYQAGEPVLCYVENANFHGIGILDEFYSKFDRWYQELSMSFYSIEPGKFTIQNGDSGNLIKYHIRTASFYQDSIYAPGRWGVGITGSYANLSTDTTLKNVHPSGDPILGVNPDVVALKSNVYTKTEVDTALALKANTADVNAALALKANASSVKTATAFSCEMADGTTKTLTMNGVLS